jgi:protein LSM14
MSPRHLFSSTLGSKISLISKKNIRYEGILYSINEANATVALQNVKSYGTEGREQSDPENTGFVAPQESIHPYLLFRGCDIKDLHVHEQQEQPQAEAPAAAAATTTAPPPPRPPKEQAATAKAPPRAPPASDLPTPPPPAAASPAAATPQESAPKGKEKTGNKGSAPKKTNNPRRSGAQVGTGASLLNRKARGSVQGGTFFFGGGVVCCSGMVLMETNDGCLFCGCAGPGPEPSEGEFDIQAKLGEFEKDPDAEDDDEAGDELADGNTYYEKDDFFDSISCDALDKQQGIDNRLKGSQERTLNTETFGAVALNSQRRRRFGRGGGRGGRGGGRGRGRGRGGRGRGSNRDNYNSPSKKGPVQPAPVAS